MTCLKLLQVITFIDLAGHERYLKTTVFGMTGHAPDFSMLMVSDMIYLCFNLIPGRLKDKQLLCA